MIYLTVLIILGIDPGVNRLGYGVISEEKGLLKVKDCGLISPRRELAFQKKLAYLSARLEEVIEQNHPEVIAIEEIYVAKNARVALRIGQVIGLVVGLGLKKQIDFVLIPPREVKQSIVGTGSATKEQVQFMVEQLTGVKNLPNPDVSDALAVAISYPGFKQSNDLSDRGDTG